MTDQRLGYAVSWYKLAAAHGSVPAAAELGYMYEQGWGVPLDYAQSSLWYRRAATAGDAQARVDLGLMYEHGQGTRADFKQAMALYEEAGTFNDEDGMVDQRIQELERNKRTMYDQLQELNHGLTAAISTRAIQARKLSLKDKELTSFA
jgi:hypothetical protein